MASPYSNNGSRYSGYGYQRPHHHRDSDATSVLDDLRAFLDRSLRSLRRFWNERGRYMVLSAMVASARRLRQNLTYNRLFSLPHLLAVLWLVVLLWGERWVFHSKVESCQWDHWEKWVRWHKEVW